MMREIMKYMFWVFGILLCSTGLGLAQTVSGTVTDNLGEPLPGANVQVKGSDSGTQADFDGNYSISVQTDDVLIFSYLGYKTEEVSVGGRDTIDVSLLEDASQLAEVVVTGYGVQSKEEITSAIVNVSEEEFNKGIVNTPTQLLQGKVAGLTISNRGGDPNGTPQIRLRGISTIGANTEPLVVIDGVIGASLDNIDPNDIESMNVLKDGSAAAIYGSRASSGVIIVITKKGRSDELSVDYNGQVSVSQISKTIEVMSADEFKAAGGFDSGSSTDWIDEVTRMGVTNVHNISATGSIGDNSNFRVSTNFRDVQGILKESGFNQFNTRANLNTSILDDKLKLNFDTSFTNRESQFGFNEALRYAVLYNPTAPVLAKDSQFPLNSTWTYSETLGLFDSFNPVSIVNQNKNDGDRNIFIYSINAKYDILESLNFTAMYSNQTTSNSNREYYPVTSLFRGKATGARKGLAKFHDDKEVNDLFEGYLTYADSFEKINVEVIGGYSYQERNFSSRDLEIGGFPDASIDYSNALEYSNDLNNAGLIVAESDATPNEKIIAWFGRSTVNYDNTIFFNASVRSEGSTKLGEENQTGFFPALGLGVDLNKFIGLQSIDLLKVRMGYGVTGALPRLSGLSKELRQVTWDNDTPGTTLLRAANPDLKWEEKSEVNLGIDFAMDRLNVSLDVYNRDIKDFIIERTVDAATYGVDKRYENAGVVNTKGLEAVVNYDLVRNDKVTYNTGVVFSTYKSVLDDYIQDIEVQGNLGAPGQNSTNMILVKKGEEIGQIWGPVYSGEVDADGTPIFEDTNGDGKISEDPIAEDSDYAVLGKGLPDFEIGWTNQVTYGNWDLNAFFRGAFGHSLVNTYRAFFEPRVGSQTGYNFVNTKLAEDKITTSKFSSLYVEKADFFRLDNLTIGYTLNNIGGSTGKFIKSLRISITGQNLFTITGYTGNDPAPALQDYGTSDNGSVVDYDSPNILAPGIDRRSNYFASRTYALGLTLKF